MPNGCQDPGDTPDRAGTARDTRSAFALVSGMFWGGLVQGGMSSSGLITRRSQVQILPPLLRNGPSGAVSLFRMASGDASGDGAGPFTPEFWTSERVAGFVTRRSGAFVASNVKPA